MRKLLVGGLAALSLLAPSSASAQLFLGVRGGYAVPSGEIDRGTSLDDEISGMPQGQVDAGVKLFGFLSVGGYGSYGWTRRKDASCPALVECSGENLRLGIQANLHGPLGKSTVWGGVFGGWEQQKLGSETGSVRSELTLRGLEGGIQAGLDLPVPLVKVGPWVSASIGEYRKARGASALLSERAAHGWLSFGLRVAYGL